MDINVTRKTYGAEDQSWLGSAHGTNAIQTITIDTSGFTKATHYPGGYLKSGLPLMKKGDGTYTLWAAAEEETPENVLAGFLFTSTRVPTGGGKVGAAILEHGRVKLDKLPVTVTPEAQATASGRIIFA